MAKLPISGAALELDTSQWEREYKKAIGQADALDAAINDLSGAVDLKINVNDSELKTAADLAVNLDGSSTFNVNVDESQLDAATEALNDIKAIGAIDLAINIAGAAGGVIEGLGRFSGLSGILELDSALATIQGRTGQMIPGAEKLISDLYTDGWGESRTQIAEVVALAGQLGIEQSELATATETAFQVATATGQDVNEVLATMDTMVKSKLVPDYTTAGDVMTTGFQSGLNKADDLLDTLGEYGTTFSGLRISAEGALSILESGMENGAVNTDFVADAVRELGIKLGEMGTDPNIQSAFDRLDSLSELDLSAMFDAYNEGKITGDEFFQGLFDAIAEVGTTDPIAAQEITNTLVGTQSEDLKFGVFANMTTQWDSAALEMEGRAAEAGTAMSDSLSTTIETGLRGIEQAAVDFLSSDAIDLDGKIEDIKTGIQNGLAALGEGATVGEALEITLGVDGIDEFIMNFERLVGNMSISILEGIALLQDPLNNNNRDDATRARIAQMGAGQLAFDLQVANPDEFEAIITQAAQRGVTAESINTTLNDTINTALAEGDYSRALGVGQGLVDALASEGMDTTGAQVIIDNLLATIKAKFDEAVAAGNLLGAESAAAALGLDENTAQDVFNDKFAFDPTELNASVDTFEQGVTNDLLGIETAATEAGETFTGTTEDIGTAAESAALVAALATDEMIAALAAMSEQAALTDAEVTNALTGNTVTTSFDAVGESAMENARIVQAAMNLISVSVRMADAMLEGIVAKVAAVNTAIAGAQAAANNAGFGGGGSVTNNTINVNTTNNVQSRAQAVANGYAIGASIRGMS